MAENYAGDSEKTVTSSYLFQRFQDFYTKVLKLLGNKSDLGHTHEYAGSDSVGGVANSAKKLSTARTISMSGQLTGSTSFDGSSNVVINAWDYGCTVYKGNTNNFPYCRIAHAEGTGSYSDNVMLLSVSQNYKGGHYGILRIELRSENQTSTTSSNFAHATAEWLCANNETWVNNSFTLCVHNEASKWYADLFYKANGAYQCLNVKMLDGGSRGSFSRRWTLINCKEPNNATAQSACTECYDSIDDYCTDYTSTMNPVLEGYTKNASYSWESSRSTFSDEATCAVSLRTPRKISLSGNVVGEVEFDGSKDVVIETKNGYSESIDNVGVAKYRRFARIKGKYKENCNSANVSCSILVENTYNSNDSIFNGIININFITCQGTIDTNSRYNINWLKRDGNNIEEDSLIVAVMQDNEYDYVIDLFVNYTWDDFGCYKFSNINTIMEENCQIEFINSYYNSENDYSEFYDEDILDDYYEIYKSSDYINKKAEYDSSGSKLTSKIHSVYVNSNNKICYTNSNGSYSSSNQLKTGTSTLHGLTKLYATTGTNTDGTMTQFAITDALKGKSYVYPFINVTDTENESSTSYLFYPENNELFISNNILDENYFTFTLFNSVGKHTVSSGTYNNIKVGWEQIDGDKNYYSIAGLLDVANYKYTTNIVFYENSSMTLIRLGTYFVPLEMNNIELVVRIPLQEIIEDSYMYTLHRYEFEEFATFKKHPSSVRVGGFCSTLSSNCFDIKLFPTTSNFQDMIYSMYVYYYEDTDAKIDISNIYIDVVFK